MFSTWLFKNIARLVLFSYVLQLVAPAHAGWPDDPSEVARFRSGLKAKLKAADPFAEVASKKDMPTLTIQTTQGDAGKWDLTVTQTHFDRMTSQFKTDWAWKETYVVGSPAPLINHPWQQHLDLQLSETGALTVQAIPQIDQLNPYYGAYNYVFNTTASTNLTLLNLVTGGFVDVQNSAVLTTKHLEAHAGIRLKSKKEISNTSTEGEEKSCILSKGQILLKTPCLDTQRGTIEGKDLYIGGTCVLDIDYSKLSVAGLLHITLPENQTTLLHDFKTPGQLLLDRAGNSAQPLHILKNLIAHKGVEIQLPNAELILGAEADTQPMVKIQAKKGAVKTNSLSLDIVKAQLYSKTGLEFEVKEKQLHIGRGVESNFPLTSIFERLSISPLYEASTMKKFFTSGGGQSIFANFTLPFKQSNETMVITEGPFTIISPEEVFLDQAEISVRNGQTLNITTEKPIQNEGGSVNIQGDLRIHDSTGRLAPHSCFKNKMLTNTAGVPNVAASLIYPYTARPELTIGGNYEASSLENEGGFVYIAGAYNYLLKPKNVILSCTCDSPFATLYLNMATGSFPCDLTFPGDLSSPKAINIRGCTNPTLEGVIQSPAILISFDGTATVGKIINYRRLPIPDFKQMKPWIDVQRPTALYHPVTDAPTPWLNQPRVPLSFSLTLPPAVGFGPNGLYLLGNDDKLLLHPLQEIDDLPRVFNSQLRRGYLDADHPDTLATYVMGREQAYDLYQRFFAPKALSKPDGESNNPERALTALNTELAEHMTEEELQKLKFMVLYYKTAYEDESSPTQTVHLPTSWLSKHYDDPRVRNPDGGVFGDVVIFEGKSDLDILHNLSTIHGEGELTLDVKTITNERTSARWIEYGGNEYHKKGGWFSSDKDSYEVVTIPCSEAQHTTGILSTGHKGKLRIKAKVLNNKNGAEILSGEGGKQLLLGEIHSTPAIDTYVVRSEDRTNGVHVVQHGIGATMHPAVIGSTGGIEGTIGLLQLTGTHVLEKEKDINLKMRRGHLGASITNVFNGITVEGGRKTTTVIRQDSQIACPCAFIAFKGDVKLTYEEKLTGDAPTFYGKDVLLDGKTDFKSLFLKGKIQYTSETKSGFSSSTTQGFQEILIPVQTYIEGSNSITLTVEANLTGAHLNAPLITTDGLQMDPTIGRSHYRQETSYNSPLAHGNAGNEGWREEQIRPRITAHKLICANPHGMMRFTNTELNVEEIQGRYETFVRHLLSHHEEWAEHHQAIPNEVIMVGALVVGYFTGGAASGLGAALCGSGTMGATMVAAAFKAVCIQAFTNFASHGDPLRTADYLVSKEGTRAILSSTVKAGLVGSGGYDDSLGLGLNVALNTGRALVGVGVDGTVGGQKINGKTLQNAVLQAGLETGTGYVAHNIGAMPKDPLLNHGAHATTAALSKGLSNLITGKRFEKNMAAASFGAVAVQMIAQGLIDEKAIRAGIRSDAAKEGKTLTLSQENDLYMAEVQRIAELSKICAASLGVVTGLDVSSIVSGASTVLEQDFIANHKRQAAVWQLLKEKAQEKPQIKVAPKEETKEKVTSTKSRSRKAAPSDKSQKKALSAAEEDVALDMTIKRILGPSPQQIFEQKLFELVTEMALEEKEERQEKPQVSQKRTTNTKRNLGTFWEMYKRDWKDGLKYYANLDYLNIFSYLPVVGIPSAFAYEGREIYRDNQTFRGAVFDMGAGIVVGKTVIWGVKLTGKGVKYVWQKGKEFVTGSFSKNPKPWENLNRVIREGDLGTNIGGVSYFEAEMSMKNWDVANIFVNDINGKGIKFRNFMGELRKIGEETGAKTLEIEWLLTNPKLKNFLIKHYNLKPGDYEWDKIFSNSKISSEERITLMFNVQNWDKITIPLTSSKSLSWGEYTGKIKENIVSYAAATGKTIGEAGQNVFTGVKSLGQKGKDLLRPKDQKDFISFVDNPKAGKWKSANYSGKYHLNKDSDGFEEVAEGIFIKHDAGVTNWKFHEKAPFMVDSHGRSATAQYIRPSDGYTINDPYLMALKAKFSPVSEDILNLDHRTLAKLIERHPDYRKGNPVMLGTCLSGKDSQGLAQQLANKMGVPVQGPSSIFSINHLLGHFEVHTLRIKNGKKIIDEKTLGTIRTFYPGNSNNEIGKNIFNVFVENAAEKTVIWAGKKVVSGAQYLGRQGVKLYKRAAPFSEILPKSVLIKPEQIEKIAATNKNKIGSSLKGEWNTFREVPPKRPANPLFSPKPSTEMILGVEPEKQAFNYQFRGLTKEDLGINVTASLKGSLRHINDEMMVTIDYINVADDRPFLIIKAMKNLMKTAQETGAKTLTIEGGFVDSQFKKIVRQNYKLAPEEHVFGKNKISILVTD